MLGEEDGIDPLVAGEIDRRATGLSPLIADGIRMRRLKKQQGELPLSHE